MIVQVDSVVIESYGIEVGSEARAITGELTATRIPPEKGKRDHDDDMFWLQVRVPIQKDQYDAICAAQRRLARAEGKV